MSILVIAEHDGSEVASSTRATITAALKIGGDVDVLVAGGVDADSAASSAASVNGVTKVLSVSDATYEHFLAENMADLVKSVADSGGYSHILAPATTFGKDFMPRIAAYLDVAQVSDIVDVVDSETFIRPIYAGNAIATVKSSDAVKLVTVRPSAFEKAGDGGSGSVESVVAIGDSGLSSFISKEESKSERPELASARVVISGGRGVGSGENFKLLEAVADKLGAAIGASRVAVDSGFVPNDMQVGQTGKIVAPDLYIAVGISGAIQHLAGMKESKVIVAINKDENAPIFEVADYGLVADLFDVLPELAEKL